MNKSESSALLMGPLSIKSAYQILPTEPMFGTVGVRRGVKPSALGRARSAFPILWRVFLTVMGFVLVLPVNAQEALKTYHIDRAAITVSGISSGGYMAQQFHVAHSATISGAAVLAAGPYFCAGSGYPFNLVRALNKCMNRQDLIPFYGPPEVEPSIAVTRNEAARATIDDPVNMSKDKVYLFSGTQDKLVPQAVMDTLYVYYRAFIDPSNIVYVKHVPAGHAMITDDYGNQACAVLEKPYINNCDYDTAGKLLQHLYGSLASPVEWKPKSLHRFDQAEFIASPEEHSMGRVGHVYVPQACAAGATCRLHVVFHGCKQYEEEIGDAFYTGAGYNEWAEANNIVVLYPQTTALSYKWFPWPNPMGCWDWWGYTDENFYLKSAVQITAVKAMIDRLVSNGAH